MSISSPSLLFREAEGLEEAVRKRVFETRDIVKRLTVISRKNISLQGMPSREAIAVFNPGIAVINNIVYLYPRIILGYFMYASAIAEVKIPLVDILENDVHGKKYKAKIAIAPDVRYDITGAEDPRVYMLGDKLAMTYTGRTKYYFDNSVKIHKTLPITAFKKDLSKGNSWVKRYVHLPEPPLEDMVVSDKDAFLYDADGLEHLYFFHRPELLNKEKHTLISRVKSIGENKLNSLDEASSGESVIAFKPASFEIKVGWATPPIPLGKREIIGFIHGVDEEIEAYRLLAAIFELDRENIVVKAVTPSYIMGPKTDYEKFGDRPHTIFPCGIWPISKNEYLISYGAGDYFSAIGLLDLNDLLAELDRGRIY